MRGLSWQTLLVNKVAAARHTDAHGPKRATHHFFRLFAMDLTKIRILKQKINKVRLFFHVTLGRSLWEVQSAKSKSILILILHFSQLCPVLRRCKTFLILHFALWTASQVQNRASFCTGHFHWCKTQRSIWSGAWKRISGGYSTVSTKTGTSISTIFEVS